MKREEIDALISRMTLEEKAGLCSGKDWFETKPVPRLGIPAASMFDGPAGLRRTAQKNEDDNLGNYEAVPATCFPTGSTMAATWDTELVEEVGSAMGEECQAEDASLLLGPAINMKRNPLCGRNFEYLSEDPYLAGKIAAAQVRGTQGQGVGANLKHFAANSQESHRLSVNSLISERALREIYLTAFEIAVKEAHPWTVMCSYNQVNGLHASRNRHLLTEILRDEWGYDGIVISDWGATKERVDSLKAGLDLEMPYSGPDNDQKIVDAVRFGELDEAVLDETVRRMLTFVYRTKEGENKIPDFDHDGHHALARRAAAEGMVLLKNEEGLLPIRKEQSVCVIGEMAEQIRFQGGGSSHNSPYRVDKVMEELEKLHPEGIAYAKGYKTDCDETDPALLQEAKDLAASHDIVVVFAGLSEKIESEGYDRKDMAFPPAQTALIRELAKVNPNLVVVLSNGSPVEMPWEPSAKAILEAYLSGQAAAGAVWDLLLGRVNPSGKLAETIPMRLEDNPSYLYFDRASYTAFYGEDIYIGYRYYDKKKMAVRFPFGHGLSYTTFAYDNLRLSAKESDLSGELEACVDITNTGKVAGAETVQLYVGCDRSDCPVRELKGFRKVFLAPGEKKTVRFCLDHRSFAHYHEAAGCWHAYDGLYRIEIGASSRDIRCAEDLEIRGQGRPKVRITEETDFREVLATPELREVLISLVSRTNPEQAKQLRESGEPEPMAATVPLRAVRSLSRGAISQEEMDELIARCNQVLGLE